MRLQEKCFVYVYPQMRLCSFINCFQRLCWQGVEVPLCLYAQRHGSRRYVFGILCCFLGFDDVVKSLHILCYSIWPYVQHTTCMPSRMTKHYVLYMKLFTYPSTRLFTGSSILSAVSGLKICQYPKLICGWTLTCLIDIIT